MYDEIFVIISRCTWFHVFFLSINQKTTIIVLNSVDKMAISGVAFVWKHKIPASVIFNTVLL